MWADDAVATWQDSHFTTVMTSSSRLALGTRHAVCSVVSVHPLPPGVRIDRRAIPREKPVRRAARAFPLEVVVVDDDSSSRELIESAITRLGHHVRMATD